MDDPNVAVAPDYTTDDLDEECQPFIDLGLTVQQAAEALKSLSTVHNNRDKALWQQKQQGDAATQEAALERAKQLKAQQEEEEAQLLKDERKKNKAKFVPIPDRPVSSRPLILPSLVAIRKIKNHQFCELWYFTNTGLDKAEKSTVFTADDNSLSIVPGTDGSHSFIPSAFAHDKSNIVQDENLTFKQFGQVTLCLMNAMVNNGWHQDHVDMHVRFWSNIENHEWHYSRLDSQQCALMLYQGNQRRFWHATISGPQAFNLSIINNEVLADMHSCLMIRVNNKQYKLIRKSLPHPNFEHCSMLLSHYWHYAIIATRPLVLSIHTVAQKLSGCLDIFH
jgi:hypothetical protein